MIYDSPIYIMCHTLYMRLSVFGSIAGFRAWGFGAQGDSYDSKLSDPMRKLGIGARVRGQSELAVCRKAVCWVPKLLVVQGGHTCEMCRVGMSPNARIQETREDSSSGGHAPKRSEASRLSTSGLPGLRSNGEDLALGAWSCPGFRSLEVMALHRD